LSSSSLSAHGPVQIIALETGPDPTRKLSEREFFIDNLLVRIHVIIVMSRWTVLAPWEFEFPFPGSLTSTFLVKVINLPTTRRSAGASLGGRRSVQRLQRHGHGHGCPRAPPAGHAPPGANRIVQVISEANVNEHLKSTVKDGLVSAHGSNVTVTATALPARLSTPLSGNLVHPLHQPSNRLFVLALAGIRRRVVQMKELKKGDLSPQRLQRHGHGHGCLLPSGRHAPPGILRS